MRTIEEVDKDIKYNAEKRDHYANLGGLPNTMQALKYQERIDKLVEEKRVIRSH
jgi:hypothetical protein